MLGIGGRQDSSLTAKVPPSVPITLAQNTEALLKHFKHCLFAKCATNPTPDDLLGALHLLKEAVCVQLPQEYTAAVVFYLSVVIQIVTINGQKTEGKVDNVVSTANKQKESSIPLIAITDGRLILGSFNYPQWRVAELLAAGTVVFMPSLLGNKLGIKFYDNEVPPGVCVGLVRVWLDLMCRCIQGGGRNQVTKQVIATKFQAADAYDNKTRLQQRYTALADNDTWRNVAEGQCGTISELFPKITTYYCTHKSVGTVIAQVLRSLAQPQPIYLVIAYKIQSGLHTVGVVIDPTKIIDGNTTYIAAKIYFYNPNLEDPGSLYGRARCFQIETPSTYETVTVQIAKLIQGRLPQPQQPPDSSAVEIIGIAHYQCGVSKLTREFSKIYVPPELADDSKVPPQVAAFGII